MPHSLKSRIKSLCYKGEITEKDRDKIIQALEQQPCEDCINREDAIKHSHIEYDDDGEGHRVIYTEDIEELPSVTPKTRWIPVSERLPDINIHVLAQFVMGGMAECYYAHNWWHIVGGVRISGDEVIAWMPLPQPYKAESEDK